MNSHEPNKRLPSETRQHLLNVAADLIRDKGLAGITLDGVAKAAGVSKGGLLHHFPSKQHLIDAIIVDLYARFQERMNGIIAADPVPTGRQIRAYLRVATSERDEQSNKLCRVLAIEARDNPTMRDQWRDLICSLISEENSDGADPVTVAIVQLATDGLWLAEMEGIFENDPVLYQQIVARLEQMTMQGEG